jgi:alcohol dehydrogenase (cytochrome c)
MKMKKLLIGAGALAIVGAIVGGGLFLAFPIQMTHVGGLTISFIRNLGAPPGTTETNINPLFKHLNLGTEAGTVATETNPDVKAADAVVTPVAPATTADWPSYNRTLTSERFSQLRQIDTKNVGKLKVLCTYDTNKVTSFETAPIMVNNALIATTEHDIFSLDPATCRENWRTHEEYP